MSNKLKQFKSLIAMAALSAAAGFAKAETQEFYPTSGNDGEIQDMTMVNGHLMVKADEKANISGVKTPYTFVSTNDFSKGFTPSVLSNATSVVSDENGRCFASTKDGKVWAFRINETGIPSIATEFISDSSDATLTNLNLVAYRDGVLYGIQSHQNYDNAQSYAVINTNTLHRQNAKLLNSGRAQKTDVDGEQINILCSNGDIKSYKMTKDGLSNQISQLDVNNVNISDLTAFAVMSNTVYTGYSDGRVSSSGKPIVNGTISSFAKLTDGVYAVSPSTNKILGVSKESRESIDINSTHGPVKVLDNPQKENTLLFVTKKSIGQKTN